jgi:hypothetical protein
LSRIYSHGFPVELALVLDAASIGQLVEIHCVDERLQVGKEVFESNRIVGYSREKQARLGDVGSDFLALIVVKRRCNCSCYRRTVLLLTTFTSRSSSEAL